MPASRSDGGGLWGFQRSGIPIRTSDEESAWNGLTNFLEDGATPIIVPMCLKRTMPAPIVGGEKVYTNGSIPFDDRTFDGGLGFYRRVVIASLVSAASLRDPEVTIDVDFGGELKPSFFSIRHAVLWDRLYVINSIENITSSRYLCQISPPLREDTPADAVCEFTDPTCVMQLAAPSAMDNSGFEQGRFGRASVSFVESFLPLV